MRILGDRALRRRLDELGAKSARRVVRPAVNAALTPVNKAAKRKAPRKKLPGRTGALRMSIGKKVVVYLRTGTVFGAIGARADPKFWRDDPERNRQRKPGNYAHLRELGTRDQAADPFLRPAMDENRAAALLILNTKTAQGIETEVRRLARKHGGVR